MWAFILGDLGSQSNNGWSAGDVAARLGGQSHRKAQAGDEIEEGQQVAVHTVSDPFDGVGGPPGQGRSLEVLGFARLACAGEELGHFGACRILSAAWAMTRPRVETEGRDSPACSHQHQGFKRTWSLSLLRWGVTPHE